MDYTDINCCIQILHERPKLFFLREDTTEKLKCFDTIKMVGRPSTIYSLIEFLRSGNVLIQTKAAETILFLFGKLKSLNDYSDALKYLKIAKSDLDFYRVDFDTKTYVQLLGIASINSNGYTREKAIKELARLKSADGLRFILLRLGDWVTTVRAAATEAIISFLDNTYVNDLLKHLSTIDWLLSVKRVNLSEVHDRIIQFILNQEFSEEFYNKIKQLDDKTRLRYYKAFFNNKLPNNEQLNRLISDKNFLVRLELLKHLSSFDITTQKLLIENFLQDHSARIRLHTLYATKSFGPYYDSKINLLLSDEVASVRELSRHLLKNKGISFESLYRQRISSQQILSGSLLGLSETGNIQDLPIFEHYIHSEKSKLIIACLTAINKFNPDKAKQHSLDMLTHPIKRVRDKAVEILAKSNDTKTLEEVRNIYSKGDYDIKKTVLKLYNKIGGWNIVGDLLLSLTDDNVNIQNLGWQLLDKWKSKVIRLFTTPPKIEIERANKICNILDTNNLKMTHSRVSLLQDLKFYLR